MATSTTSTSSRTSSTSKSSSKTKCTDKQACEKPASTSNTAVIVAVVVPVVVVGLVLGFILYIVYKRNRKEEMNDNDPNFDGDAEYLPDFNDQFEMERRVDPIGARMPSAANRAFSLQPNPFLDDGRSLSQSHTPTNPFQLPTVTDDSETLRNFAKTLQNNDFDGYKLASHSASQVSLSRPSSAAGGRTVNSSNRQFTNFTRGSTPSNGVDSGNDERILKYSEVANDMENIDDEVVVPNQMHSEKLTRSSSESVVAEETPVYGKDSFDMEASPVKYSRGNVTQSYIHQNDEGYQPEVSMQESENMNDSSQIKKQFLEDEGEEYVNIAGHDSDEDIERMKSIYQVYLDRNGTVKTVKEGDPVPEGFQPAAELPKDASNIIDENIKRSSMTDSDARYENGYDLSTHSTEEPNRMNYRQQYNGFNETNAAQYTQTTYPVGGSQQSTNHAPYQQVEFINHPARVASSIYETQSQSYHPQQAQSYYNQPFYSQQYDGSYQGYHQVQHNLPPPNMESIEELPRPSNLPFSASSHSLTSFKVKTNNSKSVANTMLSQMNQGYNPIDHPELYFHQTNGTDSAMNSDENSTYNNSAQSISSGAKVLPHHLRQSVVMTNPHQLSQNTLYKPAGSFSRVISDSRSNSLMSNANTYQQHLQDTYIKSRVSGILDDSDVMHAPSMGNILPHSGSQDDLRRQLGSSHNYAQT